VAHAVILTLGRLRQEDPDFKAIGLHHEFEASLGYSTTLTKNQQKNPKQTKRGDK
jgi:hypothetical protein